MIKPIAIYLPQFHPIAENDKAWGDGFTEWTNVKKAKPLFEGHYQPHIPHEDVGYYDLRDPDVLIHQSEMAKKFGIFGFAFYHYWFNGKQLLNTPLDNMLKINKPDFPFLYIWANENWTKRWDGLDDEIIIKQEYSEEDDLNHIKFLCENVFCDARYIKIDEKPVFIVYRTELFPDIKNTASIWREEAKKHGFKDLFLIRVERFSSLDPKSIGFDAAMEFAPSVRSDSRNYAFAVFNTLLATYNYPIFKSVFPNWDNTARRGDNGFYFTKTSNDFFQYYVRKAVRFTKQHNESDNIFFINAWNEWGEGCHLEPDIKNGYKLLEIIKKEVTDKKRLDRFVLFFIVEKIYFLSRKIKCRRFGSLVLKLFAYTIQSGLFCTSARILRTNK